MAKLKLRRIDCATGDAAEEIARLRDRLSPQGDIVSARGRELTEKVFGQALSPQRVVDRICTDVVRRGLPAVLHYTEQLDGARLTAQTIKASAAEIAEAHAGADPAPRRIGRRPRAPRRERRRHRKSFSHAGRYGRRFPVESLPCRRAG